MRGLRFAAGLAVVVILHVVIVRMFGRASSVVDLFLVLALFNAVSGNLMAGLFGGLVAGLAADTMTGGLYGLHGFADTVAGYGTALASRRLVIQKAGGIFLAFSLAASVQQAVIAGLKVLLMPESQLPTPAGILGRVIVVGVLGFVGYSVRGRFTRGVARWRRNRRAVLR